MGTCSICFKEHLDLSGSLTLEARALGCSSMRDDNGD